VDLLLHRNDFLESRLVTLTLTPTLTFAPTLTLIFAPTLTLSLALTLNLTLLSHPHPHPHPHSHPRDKDERNMRNAFKAFANKEFPEPWTFIIFPEGTRVTPDAVAKSQEISKEKGYPIYHHVLLPRKKGCHSNPTPTQIIILNPTP
jgi:hypothetical protein